MCILCELQPANGLSHRHLSHKKWVMVVASPVYTRGVTPLGAVSRAATVGQDAVKGSRHFLRVNQTVKWCSGPMSSTAGNQGAWPNLCTCAVNQRSTDQRQKWAMVNGQGHFWMVKNLDCSCSSGYSAYGSDPPCYSSVHGSFQSPEPRFCGYPCSSVMVLCKPGI